MAVPHPRLSQVTATALRLPAQQPGLPPIPESIPPGLLRWQFGHSHAHFGQWHVSAALGGGGWQVWGRLGPSVAAGLSVSQRECHSCRAQITPPAPQNASLVPKLQAQSPLVFCRGPQVSSLVSQTIPTGLELELQSLTLSSTDSKFHLRYPSVPH